MRLIRRLVAGRVDFVVIGGLAVIAHGYPRITKDVDIVYARSPANLERLGSVLQDVRARLAGVDDGVPFVPDARSLQRTSILTLDSDEGLIDLLAEPAGAASYDELRARAEIADFGDVRVPIADLDDLIAMKRAAGRPQDLADLEALAVIKRLRRERRR
jgi:hypothetical protein